MPSTILTNQSGGQLIISGLFYSGYNHPQGSILFRADSNNSGRIYLSLSGGTTVTSGTFPLSGIMTGALDGIFLNPSDTYQVPKLGIQNTGPNSGNISIYVATDPAVSGIGRVWFEIY